MRRIELIIYEYRNVCMYKSRNVKIIFPPPTKKWVITVKRIYPFPITVKILSHCQQLTSSIGWAHTIIPDILDYSLKVFS